MSSRSGFDAQLDFDELQTVVDRGSGAVSVATRQAAAQFNLGINGTNAAITLGTVKASSIVTVDSNKDVSGFRNIGLTGTLTHSGATGTNLLAMPDNLADAFSIMEGANAYLTFVTTNGSEAIVVKKNTTLSDVNIVLGTTTGTKFGTATTQKLGFFNATPIVQPAGTGTATGFTAGAGTAVNDASTFTGGTGATAYRISDIVLALKNLGLLAA